MSVCREDTADIIENKSIMKERDIMTTPIRSVLFPFRLLSLLLLLVVAQLSGCVAPGKATGGGTIAGVNGGNAVLGFNAENCSGVISGKFNFRDGSAGYNGGVALVGDVVYGGKCADIPNILTPDFDSTGLSPSTYCGYSSTVALIGCAEGYVVEANYQSTNPFHPGAGRIVACVINNGAGVNSTSSDLAWISIGGGPFSGYYNRGSVTGNIQTHSCDE